MRLIFVILIFFSGTVLSKYYEKTRSDGSVYGSLDTLVSNEQLPYKQWIFIDYETRFRAHKRREENDCYLEKFPDDTTPMEVSENGFGQMKRVSKTLYAPIEALTNLEVWRIAGGRIVDFCRGYNIFLLQDAIPTPEKAMDPFFNQIPRDENDIVTRRVADIVLTPLISRAKRQIVLEEREKLNENFRLTRRRRQAQQPRGRFRGQTQSQYLNLGTANDKEGKAEAEATQQSSRAVVSGSRGMGQAQSMSVGSAGCEDCPTYTGEIPPERYIHIPGTTGTGAVYRGTTILRTRDEILPGTDGASAFPGTFPATGHSGGRIVRPGTLTPGTAPGTTYSTGVSQGSTGPQGGRTYPGGVIPGVGTGAPTTGGDVIYPGSRTGIATTGGRVTYPGNVPGSGVVYNGRTEGGVPYPQTEVPHREQVISYPGGTSGTTTAGRVTYPGGVSGTTPGGGVIYPGSVPSIVTTGGGTSYPGGVPGTLTSGGGTSYPGGVPGTVTSGRGPSYPSGVPGTVTSGREPSYPGGVPGTVTSGGRPSYPGGVPGTVTTGGRPSYPGGGPSYPGGVPGTVTTGGGPSYPGGGSSYPGGMPGTVTTGGEPSYPGSVSGTITTGGGPSYPRGGPSYPGGGPSYPGGGPSYPGSVPGAVTTGGEPSYPGGVPGTVTTGGRPTYPGGGPSYPGGAPGTVITGSEQSYPGGRPSYPGGVPGIVTTGGGTSYTGGAPGTITSGGRVTYPGGAPGIITTGGGTSYPGGAPGTITTGGGTPYPGGAPGTITTGGGTSYPGQVITESKANADAVTYPSGPRLIDGGMYPITGGDGTMGTRVIYPGGPTTGTLPGGVAGGTPTTGAEGTYPGVGLTPPDQLRQTVHYSERTVPGGSAIPGAPGVTPTGVSTYPGGIIPGSVLPGDRTSYPGSDSRETGRPGSYLGGTFPGTNGPSAGSNIITGATPDSGTMVPYPGGAQSKIEQGGYPTGVQQVPDGTRLTGIGGDQQGVPYPSGVINYPGGKTIHYPGVDSTGIVPGVPPGHPQQQGPYPGAVTWHDGQYPTGGQNVKEQYPARVGPPTGGVEASQYYEKPSGVVAAEDDGSNSQASSSVKQTDSGTQASASAQGQFEQGTSQSQVTGTYSGSGSFSAQAGSSDNNKSAQTEINGGKEGATSSAQGRGGYGKSQAQVQLDSDSGATQSGAQSSGWNHGTNSQVQASSKGGMADAQANGEGSTSSQAQIGFQPYLKENGKDEKYSTPFHGGGTASAQSGTHRGQSQSQLQGSFQYGITYTGAAQAGSGSGVAASRKPFNFSLADTELFKSFKPYNTPQITEDNKSEVTNKSTNNDYEYNQDRSQGLQTSSSSRRTVVANAPKQNSENVTHKQSQSAEKSQVDDTMYDYEEEYEDYDTSQLQTSTNSKLSNTYNSEQGNSDQQSQAIRITTGNQYDVRVHQDSNAARGGGMLQPGQSLPGYTIPPGFRGRVTSIAGDETVAHGDGKSQSQTVSLVPKEANFPHENKSPVSDTRSLKTNQERLAEDRVLPKEKHQKNNFSQTRNQHIFMEYAKPPVNVPIKPSYYTVTNSVTGKIDGTRSSPKKYEHRYYTKSSTCGYFTFSCNVVHGSNGRTKICKPKLPTYPDGTPMKC